MLDETDNDVDDLLTGVEKEYEDEDAEADDSDEDTLGECERESEVDNEEEVLSDEEEELVETARKKTYILAAYNHTILPRNRFVVG